ncbi:hypothetical protein ACHAXN_001864 [Cyclotella atomus]|jgi:hypothetical protein
MKKGMPKNACKCRAMIVEGFERPVKTAAGVSAATYKYETGDIKMGGEVQGKPHNMQLWTMTLDVLLQIHQKECEGITMTDPTKCLSIVGEQRMLMSMMRILMGCSPRDK